MGSGGKRVVRSRRVAWLLAVVIGLQACAGKPPAPQDPLQGLESALQQAYQVPRLAIDGWAASWALSGGQVDVSWLAPRNRQSLPLILYLPGLGESAESGRLWRQRWAEAGYAVLALQPQSFGRQVYSSPEAQVGSFRSLAQRAYAAGSLQARLRAVEDAMALLQARQQAGDPQLSAVDLRQVLVAGHDLGAQTAAALAGEREEGAARQSSLRPQAVILLSPYVANAADPARFHQIDTPFLAVTGVQDEDPFSWVASALQRQNLWRDARLPGSYQLRVDGLDHAVLAGSLPQPRPAMGGRAGEGEAGPVRDASGMPPRLSAQAAPGEGRGPGGAEGRGPGGPGAGRQFGKGQHMPAAFDSWQMAQVLATSLAFADYHLQGKTQARQWLQSHRGVLGAGVELQGHVRE